jgi:hypothetical protein
MNWATAVVVIIAIACLSEVLKAKYRARHGITADKDGNEAPIARQDPALEREVTELRERIRVLERIATENHTTAALETRRVSDEIEALRDRRTS